MIHRALLLCAVLTLSGCMGPYTVAVTVRHAEKQAGPDPALTAAGQRRAEALRDRLADSGIVAVYSTDTRRTRQTAAPLAEYLSLPVQIYTSTTDIAARVRAQHQGEAVLIVGHSNTLGSIVSAFGADVPVAIADGIADNDYDNFVTIVVNGRGVTAATHDTYGASSP